MTHAIRTNLILLALVALTFSGCGQQNAGKTTTTTTVAAAGDDAWPSMSKQLRNAAETVHFKEAVHAINNSIGKLDKALPSLSKDDIELMQRQLSVDAAQLAYLEAGTLQPLDAFHLETCCTLRDALGLLEVKDLPLADQARHCLDWVCRRVVLYEGGRFLGLPPLLALRLGTGGELDRAYILLELLRKFEMDGCILRAPLPDGSAATLVGVLDKDRAELLIYDPRLGVPVRGADGKTATWAQIKKDNDLLKPHAVLPEWVVHFKAHSTQSLTSAAPRMQWLDESLKEHYRIALYQSPAELDAALAKAGVKLEPWPEHKTTLRPVDAWWRFVPVKDGALQEAFLEEFQREITPSRPVVDRLNQMFVLKSLDDEAAQVRLIELCGEVFTKFAKQPTDMALRGKPSDALRRLRRMEEALDAMDTVGRFDPGVFEKMTAQWIEKVKAISTERARGEKGWERKWTLLWNGDPFLGALLDPTNKERLADKLAVKKDDKEEQNTLSFIVMRAVRPVTAKQLALQNARCQEDKAARLQAMLEARRAVSGKDKAGKAAVHAVWREAAEAWERSVRPNTLSAEDLSLRLKVARKLWDSPDIGDRGQAVRVIEDTLFHQHLVLSARWRRLRIAWQLLHDEAGDKVELTKTAAYEVESIRAALAAPFVKDVHALIEEFRKATPAGSPLTPLVQRLARETTSRGPWAAWTNLLDLNAAK